MKLSQNRLYVRPRLTRRGRSSPELVSGYHSILADFAVFLEFLVLSDFGRKEISNFTTGESGAAQVQKASFAGFGDNFSGSARATFELAFFVVSA